MRNLKKLLALVLAFMMTMSLMVTVNAASPKDFSDLDDTSFADAINVLSALGVVEGYGDGKFQPKSEITRAEVCTIIYRIVTGDVAGKQTGIYADYGMFNDVPANQWYAGAINFCANAEIVKGDGDGTFRPNDNITGYEILAIVLRAIGYGQEGEFESSGWQIRTASTAKLEGITKNISEGTLGAKSPREMVAEIIFEALLTPTVSHQSALLGYSKDVLQDKTNDGKYPETIYNTLMYSKFGIVGEGELIRDNYGRPITTWVKDHSSDTVAAGTKYVPNGDVNDKDVTAITVKLTPVETYYVEKTECDVAKEVNNDKSLKGVSEWLNGAQAYYGTTTGDEGETIYTLTRQLDALHTTTDKIGAQGRTTEIYHLDEDEWNIIYIDTLMGVVSGVTPRTFDTNGHVYQAATLSIDVNDTVTVGYSQTDADFDYAVDDLILLTTYGGKDLKQNDSADGVEPAYFDATGNAGAKLRANAAIPHVVADFKIMVADDAGTDVEDGGWAIDLAGEPTTTTITVKGTTGAANAKTGMIATDSETYPASNVYCAEAEKDNSHGYSAGTYVSSGYSISMNNSLINQSVNLYRDPRDNIVGMDQDGAAAGDVGVILNMEAVRVGVGTYAMEATIFKADNTTETIRLLTHSASGYGYMDAECHLNCEDDHTDCITVNTLIAYEPVTTVNGVTYYGVAECGWKTPNSHDPYVDNTTSTNATGDVLVQTGVADTLRGDEATNVVLNDKTPIIIASTTFDYSVVGGENQGNRVLGNLVGYKGFKTIPTIMGVSTDVDFQIAGGTYYIYPRMTGNTIHTEARYSFVAQPGISVDKSYLVLSTVATYQDHATYKVLENGKETTLDVANTNDASGAGLNETVEKAMEKHELITVTGWDLNGYATSIGVTANVGACDNASGALTTLSLIKTSEVFTAESVKTALIDVDVTVVCSNGVMKLSKEGQADEYLTIADDCQVQIVNVANAFVTEATLAHVAQYRTPQAGTVDQGGNVSELVYELNAYGYICNIYIID